MDRDPSRDDVAAAHRDALTRYVIRLLKDPSLAQDVVQETWLRWQSHGQAVEPPKARAWLYRVARNLSIDWLRRRRRETPMPETDILIGEASRSDPSLVAEQKEERAMLVEKLNELPPRQREVVRLKFQEGLKYDEIAEVTSQTRSTVGWLLHEALTRLRRELQVEASGA